MSALTSLFTSMANKIRSKVGGSDTYTPTEMVSAIDDVYDAGIADATTPITPYNPEPAEMLANTGYKPTANGYAIRDYSYVRPNNVNPYSVQTDDVCVITHPGFCVESIAYVTPSNSSPARLYTDRIIKPTTNDGYAIESYDSVTPSSTPTSVASGDIVKIGGSGVIVDAIPTPTSITPSDSSPAALTANTPVTPSANGYAIASNPTSLTPSDSSPVAITSGTIYKAGGGGYAIESQPSNKTPDDTTPPSVTSGEIVKMGGAGYLYATQQSGFDYLTTKTISVSSKTASLTGLTSGKEYYMMVDYAWTNTGYNADITSMTNTTNLTKISSTTDRTYSGAAAYTNHSIYSFKATGTSSTITFTTTSANSQTFRVTLFEK